MRKLRLALLGIVSIFCLNSCITSALIGTAVALCGENGCNDFGKKGGKKDYGGIYVLFKENDLKTKDITKIKGYQNDKSNIYNNIIHYYYLYYNIL